jgi:hypothetical protein
MSRTSVTNIERGRQKMLLHTLWDIAGAVGVEASELLPKVLAATEAIGPQDKPRAKARPESQFPRSKRGCRNRRAQAR